MWSFLFIVCMGFLGDNIHWCRRHSEIGANAWLWHLNVAFDLVDDGFGHVHLFRRFFDCTYGSWTEIDTHACLWHLDKAFIFNVSLHSWKGSSELGLCCDGGWVSSLLSVGLAEHTWGSCEKAHKFVLIWLESLLIGLDGDFHLGISVDTSWTWSSHWCEYTSSLGAGRWIEDWLSADSWCNKHGSLKWLVHILGNGSDGDLVLILRIAMTEHL